VRISPDVRGGRLGVRLLRSVLTLGALHLFRFGFAVGTAQVIAVLTAKSCCAGLLCCCHTIVFAHNEVLVAFAAKFCCAGLYCCCHTIMCVHNEVMQTYCYEGILTVL